MPTNHITTNAASATQEAPNKTVAVSWSYPSSPNATRFRFPNGCWTVETREGSAAPFALSGYTNKADAFTAARSTGLPLSRYSVDEYYDVTSSDPAPFDFEALCNNIAAAPDLDTEADAFRTLAAFAWEHLTPEGRAAMMKRSYVAAIVARASLWAATVSDDIDPAADWFNAATLEEREQALKHSPYFGSAALQTLEWHQLNEDQSAAVLAAHAALAE